ncbi:HU family DNA-binding protein [Synechococcus sp. PCC 6312]|uniref:HU family DNA-binding protein n=1 Tax=Synechococcus sp. (strain ATCC 27167 / PCC 6312) TaxID=195253 RepID=UPI00029F064D|nr:HU family DNA-binding protein [Synechococcus sp. PCC 6312]AFY60359.1 bacterial nucleoid DNA-binding protein [Synechococcus sp. PCC 6312]
MNKSKLIEVAAEAAEFTKKDMEIALNAVLDAIQNAVAAGSEVKLVGFGTFKPIFAQAREGRNPQTGESIKISATHKPVFRAGQGFKDKVARR